MKTATTTMTTATMTTPTNRPAGYASTTKEPMTLAQLRQLVSPTYGIRNITIARIVASGEPVASYEDGDYRIDVYPIGFAVARSGRRVTAVRVDECRGYEYKPASAGLWYAGDHSSGYACDHSSGYDEGAAAGGHSSGYAAGAAAESVAESVAEGAAGDSGKAAGMTRIDEDFFLNKPWPLRIMLTADDQFQANEDNRERCWLSKHPEIPDGMNALYSGAHSSVASVEDEVISNIGREEFLGMLTDKQREAFLLYYKWGYNLSEIGERMGVSKEAVKVRLEDARRQLRKFATTW